MLLKGVDLMYRVPDIDAFTATFDQTALVARRRAVMRYQTPAVSAGSGSRISSPGPSAVRASSSVSAQPYSSASSPSESATSSMALFLDFVGLRVTFLRKSSGAKPPADPFCRNAPSASIVKPTTLPDSPICSRLMRIRPRHFCTPTKRHPKSLKMTSLFQTPPSHSPPPTPGTSAEPRPLSVRTRDAQPVVTAMARLFKTASLLSPAMSVPSTAYRRPACHFCCCVLPELANKTRG